MNQTPCQARPIRRHFGLQSAIVAIFLGAAFAQAGTTLQVAPNVRKFDRYGGESQSTIIAPGVKPQCPNGRVFVSDDLWIKQQGTNFPPATGTVRGIDLKDDTVVDATFDIPSGPKDSPTDPKYWNFVGNDHDLVSLANGDLLLCIANLTRAPLPIKPPWFDVSYYGSFGPGARTAIFIWRSTDGGQTFHFVSVFDSGQIEDGLAALPQFPRTTMPPGSPSRPVFKMGRTDGPLFYVDKTSGQIFLTHLIAGNLQDTSVTDHFELSQTQVYRTLVASSRDEGSSWNVLGSFPGKWWRLPLVRWSDGTLALATLTLGSPALTFVTGPYVLPGVGYIGYVFRNDQTNPISPGLKFNWDLQTFFQNPKLADPTTGTLYYVYAHNWAPLEMAPAGTSDLAVVAVPATVPGFLEAGHGYRVFLYNRNSSQPWSEIPAVLAENATYNTFVLHLTMIPGHGGPALLYWTEFNADTNRSTVRGRLVSEDGWYSSDFSVSLINGAPMNWSIDPHTTPWYGDYQTADSYSRIVGTGSIALRSVEYHYFPMWVEPDKSLHFTEVTFSEPLIHMRLTPTANYVSNQSVRYYAIHANPVETSFLWLRSDLDVREEPKIFGSSDASGNE